MTQPDFADVNLLPTKNGLDFGVHYTSLISTCREHNCVSPLVPLCGNRTRRFLCCLPIFDFLGHGVFLLIPVDLTPRHLTPDT
jgi:hypothetical protein